MWCCQIPGFEALVLAELQRQQQCSRFCDTLLKTDGVTVPAHSCILSAISPRISSALSSTPTPPAGQSRLLEFRALGPHTLLHMVRLLYSGEMAGEGGEEEKREAISAAAELGVHGLVEVMRRDPKSGREKGVGRQAEVGVQTELPLQGENEGRWGGWRREVRDGCSVLWREAPSGSGKDTWTQTEEAQVSAAPPLLPAASFETIDMTAIQSLGQTDPPQIPYVPISLVYPLEGNHTHQPTTLPIDYMQESTADGHTSVVPLYSSDPPSLLPFPNQAAQSAADPRSWWPAPKDIAAAEEWEGEQFEQFQGNIPGYINHFLNPEKEEGRARARGRGRPRRRQGAGVGGARRAGRPRGRTRGRGRGGLTQTVDVQDVGVGKLQKLFLQRWGMRVTRTGQGGGAVGRKLHLKTRELLNSAKSCQRRRRRRKVWEFSPSRNSDGGAGNTQRGQRSTTQQPKQVNLPVSRPQRVRPTTSFSFSSPPTRFYNLSVQPSPSPSLLSSAASYVSPASSLLHTTPVPPPALPPHEEHPEHFDRLLEEVMMGLDILPNHNNRPEPPHPASSSSFTSSENTLAQNKQQGHTAGFLGADLHGSTQVVAVARGAGGSSFTNNDVPILQQQGDGEVNEMLENFLQSFEQHIGSCTAREEAEAGGQSCTEAPVRSSQISEQQQSREAKRPARLSQPRGTATLGKDGAPASQRRKRRRVNQYLFSHEKKRVRVRVKKPASSSSAGTKTAHDRKDKQLQQMPVVKLERSGPLPARVTLQGDSCQSLEVKSLVQTKTSSSSVKHPPSSLSGKNQTYAALVSWGRKMYPIRSRFKKANLDSIPFLEEPLPANQPARKRGRPRERKRGAESKEEEDGAAGDKRVCFERPAWTDIKLRETEDPTDEGIESSGDEIIDVDGDVQDDTEKELRLSITAPPPSHVIGAKPSVSLPSVSLGSTGSWEEHEDEDIDVIGGSSPAPDPVIISWTESSEGEKEDGDEDVEVVEQEKGCTLSMAVFSNL